MPAGGVFSDCRERWTHAAFGPVGVQHVHEWVSRHNLPDENRKNQYSSINVSARRLATPASGIPAIDVQEYGVPGTTLCFEYRGRTRLQNTMLLPNFAAAD